MIDFALPGVYSHFKTNVALIRAHKNNPEWFYDNIDFSVVYGIFPFCIFDGGRIFTKINQVCYEDIEMIVNTYKDLEIPIRLVLTNTKLQPEHYHDRFGNIILKLCVYMLYVLS